MSEKFVATDFDEGDAEYRRHLELKYRDSLLDGVEKGSRRYEEAKEYDAHQNSIGERSPQHEQENYEKLLNQELETGPDATDRAIASDPEAAELNELAIKIAKLQRNGISAESLKEKLYNGLHEYERGPQYIDAMALDESNGGVEVRHDVLYRILERAENETGEFADAPKQANGPEVNVIISDDEELSLADQFKNASDEEQKRILSIAYPGSRHLDGDLAHFKSIMEDDAIEAMMRAAKQNGYGESQPEAVNAEAAKDTTEQHTTTDADTSEEDSSSAADESTESAPAGEVQETKNLPPTTENETEKETEKEAFDESKLSPEARAKRDQDLLHIFRNASHDELKRILVKRYGEEEMQKFMNETDSARNVSDDDAIDIMKKAFDKNNSTPTVQEYISDIVAPRYTAPSGFDVNATRMMTAQQEQVGGRKFGIKRFRAAARDFREKIVARGWVGLDRVERKAALGGLIAGAAFLGIGYAISKGLSDGSEVSNLNGIGSPDAQGFDGIEVEGPGANGELANANDPEAFSILDSPEPGSGQLDFHVEQGQGIFDVLRDNGISTRGIDYADLYDLQAKYPNELYLETVGDLTDVRIAHPGNLSDSLANALSHLRNR